MNFFYLCKGNSIKENKKLKLKKYLFNFINKKKILLIFLSFISILNSDIISSPSESLNPNTCKVFETFQYHIEKIDGYEYNLPPLGDINSTDEGISIGEVLSRTEKDKKIVITFRIFQSGTFPIPVSWKDLQTQEIIPSKLKIHILSSLTKNDDGKPAVMEEPIVFGKFLWYRLIIVISVFIGLGYLTYYLFNQYKKRPVDAILEFPKEITLDDILESKWNHLISKPPIYKKQFAYLLTDMLQRKMQISHKFTPSKINSSRYEISIKEPTTTVLQQATITDTVLLEKIYQSLPIHISKIREMKVFLLISKYTSNLETMDKDEAEKMYLEWKNLMNSIHEVKTND
jgi:hypothetical protein